MSVSQSTYIGPYIKVFLSEVEKTQNVFGCEDCQTHGDSADKFCNKCGAPLTKYQQTSKEPISFFEVLPDKLSDKYAIFDSPDEADVAIIIENQESPYSIHIDTDFEGELDLPNKTTVWTKHFAKLISSLTKQGLKFEIKYGVFSYWS